MRIFIVLLAYFTLVIAQKGRECTEASDCEDHQSCSFGYCKCVHGFVKISSSCFKDRLTHGEKCEHDIQCSNDHRLRCKEVGSSDGKRCICHRHFEFDDELGECINARNLTEILSLLKEQWDNSGRIESEARSVFVGLVCAGLISICLGIVFAGGCIIYGCCIPHWKMKQFPEEDFQTMPLCPVSREVPNHATTQEPTTPIGQPYSLDDSSHPINVTQTAEVIV